MAKVKSKCRWTAPEQWDEWHPDLSFDASRVLFSFCDHTLHDPNLRRFAIYKIGIDGGGLRQIT